MTAKKMEPTATEPAVAVGDASTKETTNSLVTTAAERDKIDALNLIGTIARDFSFWRRHGEHFTACRAIRTHFRLAVAAIDLKKRS